MKKKENNSRGIACKAEIAIAEGRLDDAEDLLSSVTTNLQSRNLRPIGKGTLFSNTYKIADLLKELSEAYEVLELHKAAELAARRALHIAELILGPKHHFLTEFLDQLGRVLRRIGCATEAEAFFRRSLTIDQHHLKHGLDTNYGPIVVDLLNIGYSLYDQKRFGEALRVGQDALEYAQQWLQVGSARQRFDTDILIRNLAGLGDALLIVNCLQLTGRCLTALGKDAEAKGMYQDALSVCIENEQDELTCVNVQSILQEYRQVVWRLGHRSELEALSELSLRFTARTHLI